MGLSAAASSRSATTSNGCFSAATTHSLQTKTRQIDECEARKAVTPRWALNRNGPREPTLQQRLSCRGQPHELAVDAVIGSDPNVVVRVGPQARVPTPVAPVDPVNTCAADAEKPEMGVLVGPVSRPDVPILTRLVPIPLLGERRAEIITAVVFLPPRR